MVALSHRVAAFAYGTCIGAGCADSSRGATSAAHPSVIGKEAEPRSGFWVEKIGEWATAENEMGKLLIANRCCSLTYKASWRYRPLQARRFLLCRDVSPAMYSSSPFRHARFRTTSRPYSQRRIRSDRLSYWLIHTHSLVLAALRTARRSSRRPSGVRCCAYGTQPGDTSNGNCAEE